MNEKKNKHCIKYFLFQRSIVRQINLLICSFENLYLGHLSISININEKLEKIYNAFRMSREYLSI